MYPNQLPYGQAPGYGYGQPQMGMGMGMNPAMGMGMGMNPMMGGNPYAYRTMNFTGYHLNHYGIQPHMIKAHAPMLFRKYDRNMSGSLDAMELYPLVSEFATTNGIGYINPQDVNYLAYTFDIDGSGTIDYGEFKMMLKQMGGLKFYDRHKLMEKRHKRQHRMGKYATYLGYGGGMYGGGAYPYY